MCSRRNFQNHDVIPTCDLMNSPIKDTRMHKMKILLKARRSGGASPKKKVKPANISQIVKFYLNTHNITNNPSGQDIGFMLR